MAYLETNPNKLDPRAFGAVIAIHAGAGLLLVTGLAVTGVIAPPAPPLTGKTIKLPLPPPLEPEVRQQPDAPARSQVYFPPIPQPFPPVDAPRLDGTPTSDDRFSVGVQPYSEPSGSATEPAVAPRETPSPTPSATVPPTRAVPRGNPARWVTADDYRSRWISEELTGTARFWLQVGAGGQVTGCEITRSTGHAALDTATCTLIERRARFSPARNGNGEAVAGTYNGVIVWQLPD